MRADTVAVLLFGVPAGADTTEIFNLKHLSGPCVHPLHGAEVPDDDTDLVFYNECDLSAKKLQLHEEPCSSGGFKLVHWSGKCVNPLHGSDMPDDNTHLVYHTSCDGDSKLCFQKLFDPETGYFVLQHLHSRKVVNPYHGSSAPSDQTPLVLYSYANRFESKLLLTEYEGGCVPSQASGKWVYLRVLAGSQTTTIKRGTSKSHDEEKTQSWSEKVTETVSAGIKIFGNGAKTETSADIGHDQSSKYQDEWSKNEEEDFAITFDQSYEGKVLWQWQITIEDSCGTTIPKTPDYAITSGSYEPPRCLPGYKTDVIAYQECYDAAHTLPGFTPTVEDFIEAAPHNESVMV